MTHGFLIRFLHSPPCNINPGLWTLEAVSQDDLHGAVQRFVLETLKAPWTLWEGSMSDLQSLCGPSQSSLCALSEPQNSAPDALGFRAFRFGFKGL